MITAKTAREDKREGFLVGIDDYMTKPVDEEEMLLRIKALLRRSKIVSERKLEIGSTVLHYDSLTVDDKNGSVTLPKKEFYLLYKLLSYPGQIFTKFQLLDEIWGFENESDNTLNVHINRLRNRFENNDDFTRIVAKVGDGEKAFEFLKSKGVFCEFFDVNRVVAIVSLAEKEENIKKLFEAFAQMPCFETKRGVDIVFEKVTQADFSDKGKSVYLPLNEAEGKICAESAGLYPPCVPLFVKGEKIHDAEKLFCQKDTFGLKDGKIKVWL